MKYASKYKAGDFVYRYYQPSTPGLVLENKGCGNFSDTIVVKWVNSRIEEVYSSTIRNYKDLVAEQEQTLALLKENFDRVQALQLLAI